MRNTQTARKIQAALTKNGWTVKDLHRQIAHKTKQGVRPSYETLRRWATEGSGRIHIDSRNDLERAAKALGFKSLDDLTDDPIVSELKQSGEFQDELLTIVEEFLRTRYETQQKAKEFLAIPGVQEFVVKEKAEGQSAQETFEGLKAELMRVVDHWDDEKRVQKSD